MKKMFLVVVFEICAVSFQVTAQSKPIIGYDKVVWGSSIEAVRKAYALPRDTAMKTDEDDPNITDLIQENASNSIRLRIFVFNNDKLYRVIVVYKKDWYPDVIVEILKSQLEKLYGEYTSPWFGDLIASFQGYSPDIEVEMRYWDPEYYIESEGTYVSVWYTWKKFRDEYISSKTSL